MTRDNVSREIGHIDQLALLHGLVSLPGRDRAAGSWECYRLELCIYIYIYTIIIVISIYIYIYILLCRRVLVLRI